MIGFALNIVAFIILAWFALWVIGVIMSIFGTGDSSANRDGLKLLKPILRKLSISDDKTMSSEIPIDQFNEAVNLYYDILKQVFESETAEQRGQLINSNTPSGKLSNAFFKVTGLNTSLATITRDINYVIEGSGWTEYRKILKKALNGGIVEGKDKKYKLILNNNLYLNIHKYESSNYDDDDENWNVEVFSEKNLVLRTYSMFTDASTIKPGEWILEIRKFAEKYGQDLEQYTNQQSTERRRSELFK